MNRTQRYLAGLVALALLPSFPGVSQAQTVSAPASDSVCTYDRCALWLDAPGLLQGSEGRLLARHGWFRPLPLQRFVTGDSAVHYATRYERDARRGKKLSLIGGLAMAAGAAIAFANDCGFGDRDCDISNEGAVATLTLMFGGIGIDLAAQRSLDRARRARARALWWHNRQFAR